MPPGSKFFQFHAIFGKFWQNRMLAPPGQLAPYLGEILDPPLVELNEVLIFFLIFCKNNSERHFSFYFEQNGMLLVLLLNSVHGVYGGIILPTPPSPRNLINESLKKYGMMSRSSI